MCPNALPPGLDYDALLPVLCIVARAMHCCPYTHTHTLSPPHVLSQLQLPSKTRNITQKNATNQTADVLVEPPLDLVTVSQE